MNPSQKTHRLFFALWPIGRVRSSINDVFLKSPQPAGRMMDEHNLHVTLHFLGQVTESERACLHAAAQSVKAVKFQINLDHFGRFAKAKIFWMGLDNIPVLLSQLHQALGDAIVGCGFKRDERSYAPHVTLMRKCVNPVMPREDFVINWCVDEFVLVESVQGVSGVEYRVVETYLLS